jgi:hypothetical protein
MKRKDVNGYVNEVLIVRNLLALALKQNRMLDDVKKEHRELYPDIVFRVEEENTGGTR